MKKKFIAVLFIFVALAIGVSSFFIVKSNIKDKDNIPPITEGKITLSLNKTEYNAEEDSVFELSANTNSLKTVKWSSENTNVVYIDQTGKAIAKNAGSVKLNAEVESVKAECAVTVTAAVKNKDYIKTDKSVLVFGLDSVNSQKISAEYIIKSDEGETTAVGKTFKFESTDKDIASVSTDGSVTPLKLGQTEIIISCENLLKSISVEVYTDIITDAQSWLSMFDEKYVNDNTVRFYLANDIDFSGVVYDIGKIGNSTDSDFYSAELDGNGHTVKNITCSSVYQSIFGSVWGAYVHNIAFENLEFTRAGAVASGLADVITNHKITDNLDVAKKQGLLRSTLFENVSLDLVFDRDNGNGLGRNHYGGSLNNVFVNIRKKDGSNLGNDFNAIMSGSYYGWGAGGTMNNVLIYAGGEDIKLFTNLSDNLESIKETFVCKTVIETSYNAFKLFDSSVWDIKPNEFPEIK